MQRRPFVLAALALPLPAAWAHHGWSSFDQDRPIYLQGTARKVVWKNPHAEFDLETAADLALPPDLARRTVPPQSASVDGPKLLAERAPADAQGPHLAHRARAVDAAGSVEGAPRSATATGSRCSATRRPARRAIRSCAPSTCSPAARPTACARRPLERRRCAAASRRRRARSDRMRCSRSRCSPFCSSPACRRTPTKRLRGRRCARAAWSP